MLSRITSADNNKLRLVRKLSSRKGRDEEKRFTAEGRNLTAEILERGVDIDFIMTCESVLADSNSSSGRLVRSAADSPDILVCVLPDREFAKLTDAGTGIGMLAVVKKPEYTAELISSLEPEDNILVLDRIQDPGNMGTLIRTAAAAGYKAVLAMSGTVDVYSPKVLRATAGMIFEIPVIYIRDADVLSSLIGQSGRRIVVSDVSGGVPYYEADLREGIALVIGNEGQGVSPEIMDIADVRVTLPMRGSIESLNAAVAAAILMYETIRQTKEV